MQRPIEDIAAELGGHGPAADTHALLLIDQLVHATDLDDAERWTQTRLILGAWTLLRGVPTRDVLGEFARDTLGTRTPVETTTPFDDTYVWRTDILGAITAGHTCDRCGGGRRLSVFTVGKPDTETPDWWRGLGRYCSIACWRAGA